MSRKRSKKKQRSNQSTYNIKMPVYITTMMNQEQGLFGTITYSEMIDFLKNKLTKFKSEYPSDNRNKIKKTVIRKIDSIDVKIGDIPALLLRINAFNTNLYDGYFEGEHKIQIAKDNKIGSDSNYVLFYPIIQGFQESNYTCYFLMLVYEDPTKDSGVVIRLAKIVSNKILDIPIQNIKLPLILKELNAIKSVPELTIRYYSISNSDNDIDVKYALYLQSTTMKKEKVQNYRNMPINALEELILDTSQDGNYHKKETRILWGKKEYKISQKLINDASNELNETAEKIFNYQVTIAQSELDDLFNTNFMVKKMTEVITNYISSNE